MYLLNNMLNINWDKFNKKYRLVGLTGCPSFSKVLGKVYNVQEGFEKSTIKDDKSKHYIGKTCKLTGKRITSPAILECPLKISMLYVSVRIKL